MKDDTKDILEELERELLAVRDEEEITEESLREEVSPEDALLDEILLEEILREEGFTEETLLEETLSKPAFEDPDFIAEAEEPGMYRNFSNSYGQELPEEEKKKNPMSRSDKINVGLMIANSALCLGIIGWLIYWLVKFL